jgi:hypothetical protein
VHETPVLAGLGIGVAALAAFGDVLAAGFSLGSLWVGHVNPLFLFQESFIPKEDDTEPDAFIFLISIR